MILVHALAPRDGVPFNSMLKHPTQNCKLLESLYGNEYLYKEYNITFILYFSHRQVEWHGLA